MTTSLSPSELGFAPTREIDPAGQELAWTKRVGESMVEFRLLRNLAEMAPAEAIQRQVMGASDLDISAASGLIVVQETGGDVIGASIDGTMVGVGIGWGGFVDRRPRMLSDLLAILPGARSRGLGAEMKKLQYALAAQRGFVEIAWTVDPLRAANARLNFEKLGARCRQYEVDRYGSNYGEGLYGGLPSDRLHLTWAVGDPEVVARLRGEIAPRTTADVDDLLHFDPAKGEAESALIYFPADIDTLLAEDRNAALRWRLTLRVTLQTAFRAGYEITGFVPGIDAELGAYIVRRQM